MEPQHVLGGAAPEVPQDGASVERAGERGVAVRRDGEAANGPAVSAQLRRGRGRLQRQTDRQGARNQAISSDHRDGVGRYSE